MKIDFVTLFPEQVLGGLRHSMISRAEASGSVELCATNPRDFTTDSHNTVDARTFGGGPGMLLMPEPLDKAIRSIGLEPHAPQKGTLVVFPDPCGYLFRDKHAREWAVQDRVVFVCGHYEGIDQRIIERYATDLVSLGDFVLTGGEVASMVMADAIIRQIPGVLGASESLDEDSHGASGLLSYPQYTRPEDFEGENVPEVLMSGNHAAIAKWRRQQALQATRKNRPELFAQAELSKADLDLL